MINKSEKKLYTYNFTKINKEYNSIEELANDIANSCNTNEILFNIGNIIMPDNKENQQKLEEILLKKIPNLIITHHDTDTKEDIIKQLEKIKEIYNNQMIPYFIDFSNKKIKENLKKELKK